MKKVIGILLSVVTVFSIGIFSTGCAVKDWIENEIDEIFDDLELLEKVEEGKKDSTQSGTEDKESLQVGTNPDDISLYSPVLCGHMFSSQIFFMFPFYYDNVKDFPEAFSFRVICNRIGYDFTVYETPTGMCFYNIDMKHPYNVSYQNLSSGFLLNNELLGIPDSGNIEVVDICHWGYDLPYYQYMTRYPLYVYKFN